MTNWLYSKIVGIYWGFNLLFETTKTSDETIQTMSPLIHAKLLIGIDKIISCCSVRVAYNVSFQFEYNFHDLI